MAVSTQGGHLIAELSGCTADLTDREGIRRHLITAAEEAGATVLGSCCHQFANGGVSCVVLLAESHVSIHTWPEEQYAAVDVYTCGSISTQHILNRLMAALEGSSYYSFVERGVVAPANDTCLYVHNTGEPLFRTHKSE